MVRPLRLTIAVGGGYRDAYYARPDGLKARGPAMVVIHEI